MEAQVDVAFDVAVKTADKVFSAVKSMTSTASSFTLGTIIVLCGAWVLACLFILNRKLKRVSPFVIMFFYSCTGVLVSLTYLAVYALQRGYWKFYSPKLYLCLAATSVLEFSEMIWQIVAFQNDSPTFVSLLGQNLVLWAFASDFFILGEPLTGIQLAGAIALLVVTFTTATLKSRQKNN